MAPLDEGQKSEIREMIPQGTHEAFAASSAQPAVETAEMVKVHEDMRTTTEEFVNNQLARNAEVDRNKNVEPTQHIELRSTALRMELGKEFDSTKADAVEVRTLVAGFEGQKQVAISDINAHFKDFETKSGEMKVLIDQSDTVLKQSVSHMNQIVDGVLKGVYEKLGQIDINFQQIVAKHSQYDALVGRQQQ